MRPRRAFVACLAAAAALASGCATSREGWGRGRYMVVHEASNLQVRRSTIRVEQPTGDLVMNWIGARAPTGQSPVMSMSVVVFEDRNGNSSVDPDEIRVSRQARGPAEKLLFSDVRVERDAWSVPPGRATAGARLTLRVETGFVDASVHDIVLAFAPD